MIDFAQRVHNHQYRIDPIIRNLSSTDFYKLLMLQMIWSHHYHTNITFDVTNRTKSVRLSDDIDIEELRAQLNHVRTLRWTPQELNYLRAQEFYGERNLFSNGFIDYLSKSWKLSDYTLDYEYGPRYAEESKGVMVQDQTGQYTLTFHGSWAEVTMWEIYALTIMNEMRSRSLMRDMNKSDLDIMYAQAKVKLFRKLKRIEGTGATISEFGTRRRHGHLWQEYVILSMRERLGSQFVGTSNVYFAMKHGLNAVGTNAHEIPMVLAALAKDDEELVRSQYKVCAEWQDFYRGGLRVFLPDAFGTTQFLKGAPDYLATWRGARPDSKDPYAAAEELIAWWTDRGEDPKEKLVIFSDGMDVHLDGHEPMGQDIVAIHGLFKDRIQPTFGWGTAATNDFIDCHPHDAKRMKPISLVCKVSSAEGRPAVKLSDNYTKATAPNTPKGFDEIERYRRVFGSEGMHNAPVNV